MAIPTGKIRGKGIGAAAVSLVAASLAGLGVNKWVWIVVLVIGVVLGVFAVVQGFSSWRKGKSESQRNSESEILIVTVDDEEWHPFDHRALILGVRVTVENKTDKEQILSGVGWRSVAPWSLEMMDTEVDKERFRLQQSKPQVHGTVPPHETTIGWAWAAFTPHRDKGRPGYILSVNDGLGNSYDFEFQPRPPEINRVLRSE